MVKIDGSGLRVRNGTWLRFSVGYVVGELEGKHLGDLMEFLIEIRMLRFIVQK